MPGRRYVENLLPESQKPTSTYSDALLLILLLFVSGVVKCSCRIPPPTTAETRR